jgi:hypothetical protein
LIYALTANDFDFSSFFVFPSFFVFFFAATVFLLACPGYHHCRLPDKVLALSGFVALPSFFFAVFFFAAMVFLLVEAPMGPSRSKARR